ncbi:hypothetical protein EVAR_68590_1 [Eumeta japonica]|uniref:Uncharacterized protein n=1 Tax=Eumeta variegata TaxID=151549 RepID=A0A4C2A805_EUMVA|nr:hypothetical protein EVAR_68590_1 [Eumeta japonica]
MKQLIAYRYESNVRQKETDYMCRRGFDDGFLLYELLNESREREVVMAPGYARVTPARRYHPAAMLRGDN